MTRILTALALLALTALPLRAEGGFVPVREDEAFLRLVEGRTLRIPLYGLSLTVASDGTIRGNALGWGVTGTWRWEDGYFCREMDWSGRAIPFDCQLVEAKGDRLRFTVDRGAGDSAVFRLR